MNLIILRERINYVIHDDVIISSSCDDSFLRGWYELSKGLPLKDKNKLDLYKLYNLNLHHAPSVFSTML